MGHVMNRLENCDADFDKIDERTNDRDNGGNRYLLFIAFSGRFGVFLQPMHLNNE